MIGLIFDCDGTLIDNEQVHFLAWQEVLSQHGIFISLEDYLSLFSGQPLPISQKLYDQFKIASPDLILEKKKVIYRELQKKYFQPIQKMINFVNHIEQIKHNDNIKLAVASAATKEEIILNLTRLGLERKFDEIVSGVDDLFDYKDLEGVNKPKPYIYQHAVKLLQLNPCQCIAFEDSNSGVTSAVAAGLLTVAVPNGFTRKHDFSLANFIVPPDSEDNMFEFFLKIRTNLQVNN